MNVEQRVDAWWAKQGRQAFISRVEAALADSKVKFILNDKSLKPEERLAKLEPRVDKDLVPFLLG